jgi:hypothetical protein
VCEVSVGRYARGIGKDLPIPWLGREVLPCYEFQPGDSSHSCSLPDLLMHMRALLSSSHFLFVPGFRNDC